MKNIIKKNIKIIMSVLITMIITGSITGVVAYTLNASDVSYTPKDNTWEVSSVQEAITDIKKNGTSKKFCTLKSGTVLAVGSMYECDPGDGG